MTPPEKALAERIKRRAATLQPEAQRRLLAAFDLIRGVLSEAELLRAANNGTLDALLNEVLSDKQMDRAFSPLRSLIDRTTLEESEAWSKFLPPRVHGIAFDTLNPRVLTAVRDLDTRVIQGLKDEVRETVRQAASAGMESGISHRQVARGIRDSLGLAPNQEAAVRNFRSMLETGDREALTRALRDHRFDATLNRTLGAGGKGLSAEQIERMSTAYRKRMEAFNAQTHSRTIVLDSQRLAQKNSWESAIAEGTVERNRLRQTWITVGDDRVRPEHQAMNGQTVGFDDAFSNGELIPGQSTYNCRCLVRITYLPAMRLAA